MYIVAGPPNGAVLLCSPASVVCRWRRLAGSVTLRAGRQSTGQVGGWRAGRFGGQVADIAWRASMVTSR